MNYVYILRCQDGTFYTGWTNDLERRLKAHNSGKGARYTRSRRPVTLLYWEAFESKREAMSREAAIKRLTRKDKESLILGHAGDGSGREMDEIVLSEKKSNG